MATGRSFVPLDGVMGHGIVLLGGYFEITSGTTAPTVLENANGWTVAHTSTGLYTLTLDINYQALGGAGIAYCTTSASTDLVAEFGAIDVVTNKTIVINLKTAGTLTDPTPGTGIGVRFILMCRRSKVTR